ncbi:DUF5979 domain-containing protein [Naumannella halotolerans]|uniref:Ig-like domain-containing protein n=1 Tax=Naumannella halotolerans TaxID=993414 RepID=A0A4R7J3F0_9ACTN|nr:DUF5979 domain-containing protein [Naumannella halotolerans]TDT30873.1 hypothetical protein CLV29_2280 [Naumannella halotolerans]
MVSSLRRRTRQWHAALCLLTSLVLAAGLVLVGTPTAPTEQAEAAIIPNIGVTAQLANQVGRDNGTTGNCVTYAPRQGTSAQTTFVSSPTEARTGHGTPSSNICSTTLSTTGQSVLGVTPNNPGSVEDGTNFLLATVRHYNNPIYTSDQYYTGDMRIQLSGFDTSPTLSFPWTMDETPNVGNCSQPPPTNNPNACPDVTAFTNVVSNQTITRDGISYRLVINGFGAAANGTCPATTGNVTPSGNFVTAEGTTTTGCIYAQLSQIRTLNVVKTVAGPAPSTAFNFSANSSLGSGSAWNSAFSLTPPTTGTRTASTGARPLLQGETVTIGEGVPSDPRWALSNIACVTGTGSPLGSGVVSVTGSSLTLNNVPAPATVADGPITCTVTNTYTPKATLTLVKNVTGGSATPADFTLTAAGPSTVSGPGGSAAVAGRAVNPGTYSLSEATNTSGYVPGNWTCNSGVAVTNGQITLTDGMNVTCTVTNRYATGAFTVAKTVDGPPGGFTGNAQTPFTGSYQCGTAQPVNFTVSTGTTFTSPQLPAGVSCTVTENQPSGNLADSSWSWNAPTYTNRTVTIADQQTQTVGIANSYRQDTGAVGVSKQVVAREGTSISAWTGGADRTFPVAYSCQVGGTQVASGTTEVAADQAVVQLSGLPATASCSFTETQQTLPGDFADASYEWDGYTVSPPTVTVGANGTAAATITNYFVRDTAELTLAKQLDGEGYVGDGEPFEVAWNCGTDSGTVTLGPDDSETVTVPAGPSCTVEEAAPEADLLDAGHIWGPPTYDGLTNGAVSVPANGSATVTVTNPTTPIYGAVQVTKELDPSDLSAGLVHGATFDITVECDAPAEGTDEDYSETFSLSVNGTGTTPRVPVGTDCTITEEDPADALLVDESYVFGDAPAAQTVTVDEADQVVGVTVTNTLERVYGSLDITKAITGGPDGAGASADFAGTWTCTKGDTVNEGTWSVTGAGPAELTGDADQVPLGSSCSVTEGTVDGQPVPTDSSYVWAGSDLGGTVVVTGDASEAELTVTNSVHQLTGSFGVGKTVLGGQPGTDFADTPFLMSYTCELPDGSTADGTLQVEAGGSVSGPDLPAGSDCTLTEQSDFPDPVDPLVWQPEETTVQLDTGDPQTGDSIDFTIDDDASQQVTFTNVLAEETVSVEAVKELDGAVEGFDEGTFDLTLTCVSRGASPQFGPVAAEVGEPVSFDGVPLGAECALAEAPVAAGYGLTDPSFAWDGVSIDAPEVTASEDPQTITVTNSIGRVYGGLTVNKLVEDQTGVVESDRTYGGEWSCTYGDDEPVEGTWAVDGAGTASLDGVPDEGILLTSDCTATETDGIDDPPSATDPSWVWDDPQITDDATVEAGSPAAITVTNRYHRESASLQVTKEITGETAGYVGEGEAFQVDVRCVTPGGAGDTQTLVGRVDVAPGADSPVTLLDQAPVGWDCSVAEASPGQELLADASYAWELPQIEPARFTVADTDDVVVEVTNPIRRVYGQVAVQKLVDAPEGVVDADATFGGEIVCTYGEGDHAEEITDEWSAEAGQVSAELTQVPVGSSCEATETAPSDDLLADESWTWADPVVSDPVTVAAGQTSQLTVTNTPERVYSGLTVSKVFDGEERALADPEATIGATWVCANGDQSWNGVVDLPLAGGEVTAFAADGSVEGVQVPAGSNCAVTETTPTQDLLDDASWAWQPPTYQVLAPTAGEVTSTPAQLSTDAETVASVEITNDVTRVTGAFTVTKAISGSDPADLPAGSQFSGSWTCTHPGDPDQTGVWAVTGTGSATIGGILRDSECTITSEDLRIQPPVDGDDSYQWDEWSADGPVTVVGAPEAAVLTVTNQVVRAYGTLTITKTLDDPAEVVEDGRVFSGGWTCTYRDTDPVTGTWTVTGSGPATLQGVPEEGILFGSDCTADEVGGIDVQPSLGDPSYGWNAPEIVDAIIGEDPAPVTVGNSYQRRTEPLTVSKELTGQVQGYVGEGTPFGIGVECVSPDDETLSVSGQVELAPGAEAVQLLDAAPVGWECTVTETAPEQDLLRDDSYAWGQPVITPQTFTVGAADAPEDGLVEVENPIQRVYGTVAVQKLLGDEVPPGVVSDDAEFGGQIVCTYGEGDAAQTFTDGWTAGVGEVGSSTMEVPVGASCEATENDLDQADLVDQSWSWTSPQFSEPVTITAADEPARLTVTNTAERRYSALTIQKVYAGPEEALADPVGTVTAQWVCTYGEETYRGEVDLAADGGEATAFAADGSVEGIEVPAGADCTVSESAPAEELLVDGSWSWLAPQYRVLAPSEGPIGTEPAEVVTSRDAVASVEVTNEVQRLTGELQITKAITGADPADLPADSTFSGTYRCELAGNEPQTGTWTVSGTGSTTVDGLPAGAECEITGEDTPAQPPVDDNPSFGWGQWTADGPVTVVDDAVVTLTVTNPVDRIRFPISFSKQVTGATELLPGGSEFTVQYSCAVPDGGVTNGNVTLVDGGSTPSVDLTPGSSCTVTEIAPNEVPGGQWGAPVFTVDGGTGAEQQNRTVEFDLPSAADWVPVEVRVENPLSAAPSPTPTPTGTPTPTESPTTSPTGTPTQSPTETPTQSPTGTPTQSPTGTPTQSPTGTPTQSPTGTPTQSPTGTPTQSPTGTPTQSPTGTPTQSPTGTPTQSPTGTPTQSPTGTPTQSPTGTPTQSPTGTPTQSPTETPTQSPTGTPTQSPTGTPTQTPTGSTSPSPTEVPTESGPPSTSSEPTWSPSATETTPPGEGGGDGDTGPLAGTGSTLGIGVLAVTVISLLGGLALLRRRD